MQSKDSVPNGVGSEPAGAPLDHLYLSGEERWKHFIPIADLAVDELNKLFTMNPEQMKRIQLRMYTALCESFERELTANLTVEERWCRYTKS